MAVGDDLFADGEAKTAKIRAFLCGEPGARLSEIKKAEELRSSLSSRGGEVGSPFGLVKSLAHSIFAVNGGSRILLSV